MAEGFWGFAVEMLEWPKNSNRIESESAEIIGQRRRRFGRRAAVIGRCSDRDERNGRVSNLAARGHSSSVLVFCAGIRMACSHAEPSRRAGRNSIRGGDWNACTVSLHSAVSGPNRAKTTNCQLFVNMLDAFLEIWSTAEISLCAWEFGCPDCHPIRSRGPQ